MWDPSLVTRWLSPVLTTQDCTVKLRYSGTLLGSSPKSCGGREAGKGEVRGKDKGREVMRDGTGGSGQQGPEGLHTHLVHH